MRAQDGGESGGASCEGVGKLRVTIGMFGLFVIPSRSKKADGCRPSVRPSFVCSRRSPASLHLQPFGLPTVWCAEASSPGQNWIKIDLLRLAPSAPGATRDRKGRQRASEGRSEPHFPPAAEQEVEAGPGERGGGRRGAARQHALLHAPWFFCASFFLVSLSGEFNKFFVYIQFRFGYERIERSLRGAAQLRVTSSPHFFFLASDSLVVRSRQEGPSFR